MIFLYTRINSKTALCAVCVCLFCCKPRSDYCVIVRPLSVDISLGALGANNG